MRFLGARLAGAVADGRVTGREAVEVLYAGIQRDNELLRDASGVLAERHYDPL